MRTLFTTLLSAASTLACGPVACAQAPVPPPVAPVAAAAEDPAVAKMAWPRELGVNGLTIRLYQPQIDEYVDNQAKARAAVSVAKAGADATAAAAPTYGVAVIAARVDIDKSSRMVTFRDVKVLSASFPQAAAQEADYRATIDRAMPDVLREFPLDLFEADVATARAVKAADAVPVRNDPPTILFATTPTLLILIDGQPAMRAVEGTKLLRVLNTRALIALDQASGAYYVAAAGYWYSSRAVTGPWEPVKAVPAALGSTRDKLTKEGVVDALGPTDPAAAPKGPPEIHVSTSPTEMIQSAGEPQYSPIAGTNLLYMSNTDAAVFMLTQGQSYYALVSGRWFKSDSLQGPWAFVPGKDLPPDFARIPADSAKANVRVSVPGTPEAREAVIANSIPQTAVVKPADAKLEVQYDGPPKFKSIDGAKDLEYCTNSAQPVILVERPRSYWSVSNGVWFTSTSSLGPWVVATSVPPVIYTIPTSSPVHYVTYVRIYGTGPGGVVYVGYTPGYMGTCVSPEGVVVYGTGYYYPPYVSTTVWYGYPPTYGYGAGFACGSATGFAFGFAAGAMIGGCWGHPYWGPVWGYHNVDINTRSAYRNWRGGVTSVNRHYEFDASSGKSHARGAARSFNPYSGRSSVGGYSTYLNRESGRFHVKQGGATYNPHTGTISGAGRNVHGDVYDGDVDVDRAGFKYNTRTDSGVGYKDGDVYAGHDGNVYRHTGHGWQKHSDGGWHDAQKAHNFSEQRQHLESRRSSRQLGDRRIGAARGGGHFTGRRR